MNMINISKATEKEIRKFNKKAWHKADIEHYGSGVRWVGKSFVFKAKENGKIMGSIKAKYEGGVIYVKNIIVDESERGRGIGRKLMEKVEREGKKLGGHKIYLFTMEKWGSSKFYKSLGFRKTADLRKHFLKRDFVIYSKLI
ncbi:MAG: GNAT family N-acetyltransferase [Candidatus Paceibacterota bacterium]